MPGSHHLPGASDKQNRQYEHIRDSYLESGKPADKAKEIAAKTVNAQKSRHRLGTYGEDVIDKG